METKNEEVQKYVEGLGWTYYEKCEDSPEINNMRMGDGCYGYTWYKMNVGPSFNTGSDFYLAFRGNIDIDDEVLINIYEETYSSYSQSKHANQYHLKSLKELPTLMRFKRIV